ncbi:hypothetical protein T439DRAFT_324504 [Meredithblackwellia eburnea MCA 4105]
MVASSSIHIKHFVIILLPILLLLGWAFPTPPSSPSTLSTTLFLPSLASCLFEDLISRRSVDERSQATRKTEVRDSRSLVTFAAQAVGWADQNSLSVGSGGQFCSSEFNSCGGKFRTWVSLKEKRDPALQRKSSSQPSSQKNFIIGLIICIPAIFLIVACAFFVERNHIYRHLRRPSDFPHAPRQLGDWSEVPRITPVHTVQLPNASPITRPPVTHQRTWSRDSSRSVATIVVLPIPGSETV